MNTKTWKWISNLGVSDDFPRENAFTRFFNQMSLGSAVGGAFLCTAAIYYHVRIEYLLLALFVTISYSLILVFNGMGKIFLARYFNALIPPVWVSTSHLLVGGFFSQSLAICASLVITYILLRNRPKKDRNWIYAFTIIIYQVVVIYVNLNGPLLGTFNFPFDDFVIFSSATAWLMGFLYLSDREREELITSLSNKNNALQEKTEELERFTYIASHDLKSPLRTISGFINLIERDVKKGKYDSLETKLQFVKSGTDQMTFLIEDILELSTMKNVEAQTRTLTDLNVTVKKAMVNLTEDIKRFNANVYIEALPLFECNEVEFLLLFQNFIQNGIKYNKSTEPTISISNYQENGKLHLVFADNGIGIAPQYHEQIFLFFKRLHTSNEYQGTGLGLGLCKKIISNYDGSVSIESTLNIGTTFTLSFPISKSANSEVYSALEASI